jgi:hypothetical protein
MRRETQNALAYTNMTFELLIDIEHERPALKARQLSHPNRT